MEEFLQLVAKQLAPVSSDPDAVTRAVLGVLSQHISAVEVRQCSTFCLRRFARCCRKSFAQAGFNCPSMEEYQAGCASRDFTGFFCAGAQKRPSVAVAAKASCPVTSIPEW